VRPAAHFPNLALPSLIRRACCYLLASKSFYPALPAAYYESVLGAAAWERAWLVGPAACLRAATARRLVHAFPGKMVLVHSPAAPRSDPGAAAAAWQRWEPAFGVVADFLFMRAAPGILVLGLGSFSFWAGWLNQSPATEVRTEARP